MKKKSPQKITYENLKKYAFKYIEKYSTTENQLRNILKRKIIKSSYFFSTNPEDNFNFIDSIVKRFKEIGLINDKKFCENRALNLVKRGFSKKKIFINLKQKGVDDLIATKGINSLEKFFFNFELASALIYAKKKRLISFKNKEKSFEINKKNLMKMSRAGFSYDISKKIINLNSEEEFIELERYANDGAF